MAEIVIPLMALGGLYLVKNNSKEGFKNVKQTSHQTRAKYYDEDVYTETEKTNPVNSVGSSGKERVKLAPDGRPIDKNNFRHNNMQPFFGAKIKGNSKDYNQTESILDTKQGLGSQYHTKKETAPLFKPKGDFSWANGTPSTSEFFMSRINPSMKVSNVKPFEEEKVGPGLGLGYTANTSGSGYNAGMEYRDAWLPKTVDDLRTKTNPKVSYGLEGHQGPATSYIKDYGHIENMGRVEKNRPDRHYELGHNRLFTTTGAEFRPTADSHYVIRDGNRSETTTEYYGNRTSDKQSSYVKGEYSAPHRKQLGPVGYNAASAVGKNHASKYDYGNGSYNILSNNRSTTTTNKEMYGIAGVVKAAVAPILDIFRPTKRQEFEHNIRQEGNLKPHVSKGHVFDRNDRTRTTIREQTGGKLDNNHLNIEKQGATGYMISNNRVVEQNRDTTSVHYMGGAGATQNKRTKSYEADYKQRLNNNKIHVAYTNHGNTSKFNNKMNINVNKRDADRMNNRTYATAGGVVTEPPSKQTYGAVNSVPQQLEDYHQNMNRIHPDMLKAFKDNPYTKPLNSFY